MSDFFIPMYTGAGVYTIKNETKNIVYVGSSKNVRKRLMGHFRALNIGAHKCKEMQSDYEAGDDFRFGLFKTIHTTFPTELCAAENAVMDAFLKNGKALYNQRSFGGSYIPIGALKDYIADIYCKEHYGMTFNQLMVGKSAAEVEMFYLILRHPEDEEALRSKYADVIRYQKRIIYYETHGRDYEEELAEAEAREAE